MQKLLIISASLLMALAACSSSAGRAAADSSPSLSSAPSSAETDFSPDSAYAFVAAQVAFGPRVPGTDAHARCAAWLEQKLRQYGAEVTLQRASLQGYKGKTIPAVNIFARLNPSAPGEPLLLLAHWDSRPWADKDPDPANHTKAVDGANDGASGVAVILEAARILSQNHPQRPVDILFVDAEDSGDYGDDDSWALGAKYFVENPVIPGYRPAEVILLDMVGARGATFRREYLSETKAPDLNARFWLAADQAGHADRFLNELGGAITDDHVHFLDAGIPAIDIIEFDPRYGFNPAWHTTGDSLDNIDPRTLLAVGQSLLRFIQTPTNP